MGCRLLLRLLDQIPHVFFEQAHHMTGQRHAILLCPHYAGVQEREQEPARGRDGRGFAIRSSRFSERRTLNFELRIVPCPLGLARLSARVMRLTSQSTVLYDTDEKMARGWPTLFMTVRREIAQPRCETGTQSREGPTRT